MYQVKEKDWKQFRKMLPEDDKKCTGVIARDISRSHMFQHIIDLMYEGAITEDELKEFSEDLRNTIKTRQEIDRRYFGS